MAQQKKLRKPRIISSDKFRSKKWDEIVNGRDFKDADIPALTLLVQWYQVVDRCINDMSVDGGIQVAFMNDLGDLKALPQINVMKTASTEIRSLNKQLGINDMHETTSEVQNDGDDFLSVIQFRRKDRKSAAAG